MTAAVPAIMSTSDEGKKMKGWSQLYLPFLGEKTLSQKCLLLGSEWPELNHAAEKLGKWGNGCP